MSIFQIVVRWTEKHTIVRIDLGQSLLRKGKEYGNLGNQSSSEAQFIYMVVQTVKSFT